MEGTLVVVYDDPTDLEVMDEFLRIVHGFPETLLALTSARGGAKENMGKLQKEAAKMGINLIELPSFAEALELFSPDRVIKIDLTREGKFDATEIAADINNGDTVMVAFGDELEDVNGESMHLEQSMGPVGAVAVVLHEINKFIISKEE